jgi:hypothetical protein
MGPEFRAHDGGRQLDHVEFDAFVNARRARRRAAAETNHQHAARLGMDREGQQGNAPVKLEHQSGVVRLMVAVEREDVRPGPIAVDTDGAFHRFIAPDV